MFRGIVVFRVQLSFCSLDTLIRCVVRLTTDNSLTDQKRFELFYICTTMGLGGKPQNHRYNLMYLVVCKLPFVYNFILFPPYYVEWSVLLFIV